MSRELYQQYDFIILGEHLAALWGACHLLEKELKVLVIPFNVTPEKNFAPDFALTPLELPASAFASRDEDPIQIITPQKRFRLFSDPQKLSDEYLFVFGKKLEDLTSPESVFLRGLSFLHRGSETGPTVSEDWKTLLKNASSTLYFNQEPGWLRDQFFKKIRQLGGHVMAGERVQRIFIEKKTFTGVQLEGSSSMILGSQVLVGTHWDQVQNLCNETTSVRSAPIAWSFEIQVQVEKEAIPSGLTNCMIFVQDDAPIVEFFALEDGEFVLRTSLPYQEQFLERREQRKIAQRLFKLLGSLIPDLEYNLKRMSPNLRDPEKVESEDLPRIYPFQQLAEIPVSRLKYASPGLGAQSPIQNMWFAYEEAFPRLGEWGAYQAVSQAIQAWGKQAQKPDLAKINAPL